MSYTSRDRDLLRSMRDFAKSAGLIQLEKPDRPYTVEYPTPVEPWRTYFTVSPNGQRGEAVLR